MCILVHAVKRQQMGLPLEGRISNALVEVGPSITLASISEVLAFAVGTFIPMPACRVFSMFAGKLFVLRVFSQLCGSLSNSLCANFQFSLAFFFTALAVLLDFLLQVTAFVALIVLDFLRAEDRRVDCLPCIKVSSLHADTNKGY